MPVLLASAYHPPVGYMAEAILADELMIEAFETYQKQTYRNHCVIYGPNGRQSLSIPVVKVYGNHTPTREIRISTHQDWQKIHWRSIETAYNNSPFFLYYQDKFIHFYEKKYSFLLDLNLEILHTYLQLLKINTPVSITANYQRSPMVTKDLRDQSGLKQQEVSEISPPYRQVFESRSGFLPGLSFLDVLFNLGPETLYYLNSASRNHS
jgi:hypothetical protein